MRVRWVLVMFASVVGVIWLAGASNLPRAVMVGDNLKQAKTIGAKTKIVFKVVDEEGTPVSGAKISVGLFLWSTDHNGVNGVTDRKGVLVVRGATVGDVRYSVNKEGYYYTHGGFYIPRLPGASLKDGKWQPYGMEHKVVLKRIRNPIPMYAKSPRDRCYFLELNKAYGFDAMIMDWVQPMGLGKHVDILVEYRGEGLKDLGYREGELVLSWVDPECGFYPVNYDGSEFKSPYHAQTNQSLTTSITLFNRRDSTGIFTNIEKCLVFRIRPRFSRDGTLLGSFYGKIYGSVRFSYSHPGKQDKAGFGINIYTNPTENDTNLEFLPYHSLNYPSERDKQPNIAP